MAPDQADLRLREEVGMFHNLWKGGYFEGDPLDPLGVSGYSLLGYMSVLHVTYLLCIRPYVTRGSTVLEIGPGRGAWTKCFLDAKQIWCLDALSAEHNGFHEYVGRHDHVNYLQVEDFSCRALPEDAFDYFFSFGCFCHISPAGTREYLQNLWSKLKSGCHGFIMVGDYDKHNRACGELEQRLHLSRYFQRRLCLYLPIVLASKLVKFADPRKLMAARNKNEDTQPRPGRWYHLGTKEACDMLESLGYRVVVPDVGVNHRDPVIHFLKP
jgi:Methyltransferase domain